MILFELQVISRTVISVKETGKQADLRLKQERNEVLKQYRK